MFGKGSHCIPPLSWITTTIFFFTCSITAESAGNCTENIDGCCFGYFRISKNICEKCMPGYVGLNCTSTCPHPTYGERCQGYCNCSNETCDVSTGCKEQYNTSIFTKSLDETVSKTDQMLLLFIIMIGGVDIVLLSAYLVLCIYDRPGQEKKVDSFSHGKSTVYENVSFSVLDNN